MAQFDVFRESQGELLVDCQSDALAHLGTRLAVPLLPLSRAPERRARLNPVFEIDGMDYSMVTQHAAAIRVGELRNRVTSLEHRHFDIIGALDMLLTGV